MGPLDREFFEGEEMRAAPAARDIGTVYRLLGRLGVSQRQIAERTDQSQSEVDEGKKLGAAVALYTRWLEVPAPEAVTAALAATLAELHTEAGW
ncbi:MAG: hypothetical protein ACRDRW_09350 [Pseudonocardiaceae bacterium]